ncbi:hypothetical protein LMH73_004710 [Vibrio splendidus]|nr:hypothetical protein [Vibrio splendidus]MCC4882530.1 hypothetical protein [Vibrio splendidus]
MTNLGFQITEDDIQVVLSMMNVEDSIENIEAAFDEIDYDLVEKEALRSTDFDEQVSYAHLSIKEQITQAQIF